MPTGDGARETRVPIRGVRRATAQQMVASAFTAPHATAFTTVDATRTVKLLDRLRERGVRDGDWVRLKSRAVETTLRAEITDRVAPGVVYTTFHHPDTQANVITTDYSDWATNCPEYKVTAVQISPSNGPSDWQKAYDEQARHSRRIAPVVEAAE